MTADGLTGRLLPRANNGEVISHLATVHEPGDSTEVVANRVDIDLVGVRFHHVGSPVAVAALRDWRESLIGWASDEWGYPGPLGGDRRKAEWNVALGRRLVADLDGVPEAGHPEVHAWLASRLVPDLVQWRWGWPAVDPETGQFELGARRWSRFGTGLRNGLRAMWWRSTHLGDEVAEDAIEDEFQAVIERPVLGNDPRVARIVLEVLIDSSAKEGRSSDIGRGKAAQEVMKLVREHNALRPLRFLSDDQVRESVVADIDRFED